MSSLALALVKDRYWGLPWYWPQVVLLDGSDPCDIAMAAGEDYLVSGRRVRYGMLDVNSCSRTQPLSYAQIDLRTLDGSHCASPGGTLIGRVTEGGRWFLPSNPPVPNAPLTLRDQDGRDHTTMSDADGIYELQHLAPGDYTLDSHFSQTQYLSSQTLSAVEGTCLERHVLLRSYDFSGRTPPGLQGDISVRLLQTDGSPVTLSDSIETDGKFFFSNVPDGEYLLAAESGMLGANNNFYYPGTFDLKKAAHIKVVSHKPANISEFNFNLDAWPLVPVMVTPDPPHNPDRYSWRVRLLSSDYVASERSWTVGEKTIRIYAARGASYKIVLYGFSNHPTEYDNCASDPANISAQPGLIVRVKIPSSCQ